MSDFKHGLTFVSIGLAVAGLIVGLFAAWYWYRSSKVESDPSWGDPQGVMPSSEPTDRSQANGDMIIAGWQAFRESAALNKTASILTAFAVVLSGLSAVVGSLAGFSSWVRPLKKVLVTS